MTREKFEELTARLLRRTEIVCQSAMEKAVKSGRLGGWKDIHQVLLVGGSSRMPQVPALVRQITGKEPKLLDPDLAVAKGAALYSEIKPYLLAKETGDTSALERYGIDAEAADAHLPKTKVTRVCSFALGVRTRKGDTDEFENSILIARNSPLPAKGSNLFGTSEESQRAIQIDVLEGEDPDPEHCTRIGGDFIRGIPAGLPKNSPVEVTFELTDESCIRVHAIETTHGRELRCELKREVGQDAGAIRKAASQLAQKTVA
jgi:molecular chaperone DnaK